MNEEAAKLYESLVNRYTVTIFRDRVGDFANGDYEYDIDVRDSCGWNIGGGRGSTILDALKNTMIMIDARYKAIARCGR
jgi:hypothetical protein